MKIPFAKIRFGIGVFLIFCSWNLVHLYTLYLFDYKLRICLIDSLVSNALLFIGCVSLNLILALYRPTNRRYDLLIGWSLGMALLVVFLSLKILRQVFHNDAALLISLAKTSSIRLGISFLFITCCTMISSLWFNQIEQKEREARKRETENLKRDAELFRLQQQLQPHFLFNSLNSINALIGQQPDEAKRMIYLLSDFLRGTLKKEQEIVSLQSEIEHLDRYLAIEKIRFGDRLIIQIKCDEMVSSNLIPAMILQPLLENAIKFGVYGFSGIVNISVSATNVNELLELTVSNPYDSSISVSEKGTGFGLAAISRRLYLLYGRTDLLLTHEHTGLFTATLKIPQFII